MSQRELNDFLSSPWIARLSTISRDGTPHVTPMWYLWEPSSVLVMVTRTDRVKYRNLMRNNRAAVCIDSPQRPYKAVLMQGVVELTSQDAATYMSKIVSRYEGPPEAGRTVQRWLKEPRILVFLRPNRIVSWDNSKR